MINNFWERQYVDSLGHHNNQNDIITHDIFRTLENRDFINKFKTFNSILEFGCGTGHLCNHLKNYKFDKLLGVDICQNAINNAIQFFGNHFQTFDILNDDINKFGIFDCIITSNTLEHFLDPFVIVDKLLTICKYLIVIVPYNQESLDIDTFNNDIDIGGGDGGGGHYYKFVDNTFENYSVIDKFTFRTDGWTMGNNPLQIVYIIEYGDCGNE